MATKLKIVDEVFGESVGASGENSAALTAPQPPEFNPAPTRKQHAGWTAERQRAFIEHLALTGCVGDAAALVGLSSRSAYRLRNRADGESFARAWDAALRLAATRLAAIAFDRALHGRSERYYRDGELVMERKMPSDYLLTWLLARLDPVQFGSGSTKAPAATTGDPRERSRNALPALAAALVDVSPEDCPVEAGEYMDERLGEMGLTS